MADQTTMDPNLLSQLLQALGQNPHIGLFSSVFGQPQGGQNVGPPFTDNNILGYLSSGRPIVGNADGSFSTHRNMVVSLGGKSYIVPTIFGGKEYSPDQALEIIKKNNLIDPDTGQKLIAYKSDDEALKAEQELHDKLEQEALSVLGFER